MDKKYIDFIVSEAFKEMSEPKEATGASSAGGYTGPAFSMFAKDDVARSEYKRPKVKEVREEEYCDSCDRVKSKCVCSKKIEATEEGEFTEATGSGSVGAYDAPGFQDVNMKGNTLRGKGSSWRSTQIPGGDFVSVKEKCKTFPYCNQGDINALNLRKGEKKNVSKKRKSPMKEAIYNVSVKTGLSETEIKNILLMVINDNL
jgi:hypothetical protein